MSAVFDQRFCEHRNILHACMSAKETKNVLKDMARSARRPIEFGIILSLSMGIPECRRLRKKCMNAILRFDNKNDSYDELPTLIHIFDIVQSNCGSFKDSFPYDNKLWYDKLRNCDCPDLCYIIIAFIRKLKDVNEDNYSAFCNRYMELASEKASN